MKYKFITISAGQALIHKRAYYLIISNSGGDILGRLEYYPAWRQYVFSTAYPECVFNNSCLRDILDFMENHAGKE